MIPEQHFKRYLYSLLLFADYDKLCLALVRLLWSFSSR
jgi:hypothetical protein